jgi:hypothetical protein
MIPEDAEAEELKKSWRSDFVQLGGFDHLLGVYAQIRGQEGGENGFGKLIQSLILKIFRHYLVAAFTAETNGRPVFRPLVLMSLFHLPISVLVLCLKEHEEERQEL